MTSPAFACVDWGTSGFRLWLTTRDGTVLGERKSRQGMTVAAEEGFAAVLANHLAALSAPIDLPVIICGMAGAKQGWKEAGYADVPTALDGLAAMAVRIDDPSRDIRILPGLAQRKADTPDVMRGEETQLIGALADAGAGTHRVCMPGTHSKWVTLTDGVVTGFSTYMTGETFAALSEHTILKHALAGANGVDATSSAFAEALQSAFEAPGLATNLMFTIRARGLLFAADAAQSAARLSGTLIGLELAGALKGVGSGDSILLVAEGRLADLYRSAFHHLGRSPRLIDADRAVLSGLLGAARALWP